MEEKKNLPTSVVDGKMLQNFPKEWDSQNEMGKLGLLPAFKVFVLIFEALCFEKEEASVEL